MEIPPQVLGDSPLPLYIATKEVNETRFAPLHEAYPQIAYLSDLLDEALPGINPLYLGPIEQVHLRGRVHPRVEPGREPPLASQS